MGRPASAGAQHVRPRPSARGDPRKEPDVIRLPHRLTLIPLAALATLVLPLSSPVSAGGHGSVQTSAAHAQHGGHVAPRAHVSPRHQHRCLKRCHHERRERAHLRWLEAQCSDTNVNPCIALAALHFGQSVGEAQAVAECESTDYVGASNGTDFGLEQFLPSTYMATRTGQIHGKGSLWHARWAAWAAMEMWSEGQQGQWECWYRLGYG